VDVVVHYRPIVDLTGEQDYCFPVSRGLALVKGSDSMRTHILLGLIVLSACAPSLAQGAEAKLPAGLSWCQSVGEVLAKIPDAREMSDDVFDSTITVWGVEGFLSAILDDSKLIGVRFRAFETPADLKKIRSKLVRSHGEGSMHGSATRWAAGTGVKVELKLQSEQIFVGWETAPGYCGGEVLKGGLSDQEKADAEAMKDKKAVNWDPYADDVEEQAVKKKQEEKKKEEKKKEEKKKEEPTLDDGEIDW